MKGVSGRTVANMGGLLAGLVAFAILTSAYVLVADKKPIRSDWVVMILIVALTLFIGATVVWLYANALDVYVSK